MWVDRNPCASNPQHPSTAEKATCISGVEPLCISVCSACTQQIASFRILNFKLAFHHNRGPYQSDRGAPPREIFKGTACSTTFSFKCSDEDQRMGRKRLMLTLLAAFCRNPLTQRAGTCRSWAPCIILQPITTYPPTTVDFPAQGWETRRVASKIYVCFNWSVKAKVALHLGSTGRAKFEHSVGRLEARVDMSGMMWPLWMVGSYQYLSLRGDVKVKLELKS